MLWYYVVNKHTETLLRKKDCCTYSLLLVMNKGLLYLFIVTCYEQRIVKLTHISQLSLWHAAHWLSSCPLSHTCSHTTPHLGPHNMHVSTKGLIISICFTTEQKDYRCVTCIRAHSFNVHSCTLAFWICTLMYVHMTKIKKSLSQLFWLLFLQFLLSIWMVSMITTVQQWHSSNFTSLCICYIAITNFMK
jgi:hypothetical protein